MSAHSADSFTVRGSAAFRAKSSSLQDKLPACSALTVVTDTQTSKSSCAWNETISGSLIFFLCSEFRELALFSLNPWLETVKIRFWPFTNSIIDLIVKVTGTLIVMKFLFVPFRVASVHDTNYTVVWKINKVQYKFYLSVYIYSIEIKLI